MAIDEKHDTIFEEENNSPSDEGVHVDFDLMDTPGKWLLKVVSGPNTGAEFSMHTGSSYLIGTDTSTCDVVFHDLSVSRQHTRLSVDPQNHVTIEDLGSKNGTFVEGEKLSQKLSLQANALITTGTTTFMLLDLEGDRKTIVSPPVGTTFTAGDKKEPTTNKNLQDLPSDINMGAIQQATLAPIQSEVERIKEEERKQQRHATALSALMILAAITGLFVLIGVGTTMLFRPEAITQTKEMDAESLIAKALHDYPQIRYSYNPANGRLLLIGHVLTAVDRSRILDSLGQYKFITGIDSSNIVIDEYVWREINQIISKNPLWKSITISSPIAGKFVMNGFLKSRKQGEELSEYVSSTFPYPDLLENKTVVEEDLKNEIAANLVGKGFRSVVVGLANGELTFTGSIAKGTGPDFAKLLAGLKTIPGIRTVQSFVTEVASDQATINISDRYQVSGYSSQGSTLNVVINGKILNKGDSLDGMIITSITPSAIFLEKEGFKYKIDFNR